MMKSIVSAALISAAATAASAQDMGQITVGAGLSTFGANLEAAYQVNPTLRLRGALMGGVDYSYSDTESEAIDGFAVEGTTEGDAQLGGFALLADYYPTGGAWRVSGGVFVSNTELTLTSEVDLATIGAEQATISGKFFNEIAPMVTAGYEYRFGGGWALTAETGVVYTNGIDLSVTATDPTAQAEIDADADVIDAISTAKDVVVWPYVSLGVTYRF